MGVLCCAGRCIVAGFLGCSLLCVSARAASSELSCVGSNLRVLLGISGVYSYKSVVLEGVMTTEYDAGYILPYSGVRTLRSSWDDAPQVPASNDFAAAVHDWQGAIAGLNARDARKLVFCGWTQNWPRYNGAAWTLEQCTPSVVERALCAPSGDFGRSAYVLPNTYHAEAPFSYKPSFGSWIVRLSFGVAYDITEIFSCFLTVLYALDLNRYGDHNTKDGTSFVTEGLQGSFKSVRGTEEANLIKASFAYNEGRLASGVSVSARTEETFGVMAGVSWWPDAILQIHVEAGVKRYVMEAIFSGGDLAIPGTLGAFARSFTHSGDRCKLLVTQGKRTLYAVKWPLVFGAGVRLSAGVFMLTFDVGYTHFEAKLESIADNETSSGTGEVLSLNHPFTEAPGLGEVVDGDGIHQFKALDVRNVIHARMECEDWTFGVGCMVTI